MQLRIALARRRLELDEAEKDDREARRLRHQLDPVAFASEGLGIELWGKQRAIARALMEPPHRVLVKSANNIGKSFVSGALATWFYLTRDPACVILTAPTNRQVKDITFKEVRRLYGDRPGILPKNPRIEDHVGHLMTGFTADNEASFQGLREKSNLIIFEECVGIAATFWEAARGMLSGGDESYWLAICNPTDSSSHAYQEEQSGAWHVLSVSAFEHPNILAELEGRLPPIPAAVRLAQLVGNMGDWGEWIDDRKADPVTDVDLLDPRTYGVDCLSDAAVAGINRHFPSRFWRPAPEGEARICGRYPSQSAYSVFSEVAFQRACQGRTNGPEPLDP